MPERFVVGVTYDPAVGYRTTGCPELPVVSALSLGGIRRRVEALMLPDDVRIVLHLDRRARLERDRRPRGGVGRSSDCRAKLQQVGAGFLVSPRPSGRALVSSHCRIAGTCHADGGK
jgi:hypothetical protein